MLTPEHPRPARYRLLVTGVVAVFAIGAAPTAAQAGSGDPLKDARAKYKAAQTKCIKHHQLKQLPRILKLAEKIKKLGGGKIKKKQLYKCIGFTLSFDDDLTLKGSYHGGGWTYTHNWDYSILQVGSDEQLKPDFKSATRHDVESSGELTMIHTFNGTASSKADGGNLSATQKSAGAKGPHGYAATVSIDPSAKDPRKTIELLVAANPQLEHYHTEYTGGGGGSSDETGQVWMYAYNFVHRKQKPPIPAPASCTLTLFKVHGSPDGKEGVADRTLNASASMPLGTARNSQDCAFDSGTNSIPDTSRYDPWVIPRLDVTDSTSFLLKHAPSK